MSERYMKDFNGEKVFSLEYDKATLTDMVCELQEKINKTIKYINLLEYAFIERNIEIDYMLLDTARQLLEDNIEIPEITIKYLRGDKE